MTTTAKATTDFPKAVLYTFQGSLWASVASLCLVEKGYSPTDYEVRQVNLFNGENFAPTFLRVNPRGTVPTLVVPIAVTTGQEVDTKFRAIDNSIEIAQFLDSSRSQQILDSKGEDSSRPAPVLAPATIEGKAASDELITLVHSTAADGNALFLAARTEAEFETQRKGIQGTFCKNREAALKHYKEEAVASAGGENPRTAAMTEKLVKWYNDKTTELSPLHNVYLTPTPANTEAFIALSRRNWSFIVDTLYAVEKLIAGPYALGDQVSLADLHLIPWLARLMAIASQAEGEKDEVVALEKALSHDCLATHALAKRGLGVKIKTYWTNVKTRPSYEAVYGSGLH
ncbi:hypothetical protein CBS101457_000698 [Exobasidium rhododendri]|nr:hypothetical protein CBS101457_000698 [Exobasidium rhododendri]